MMTTDDVVNELDYYNFNPGDLVVPLIRGTPLKTFVGLVLSVDPDGYMCHVMWSENRQAYFGRVMNHDIRHV